MTEKEQFILDNYQTMPVVQIAKKGKMANATVYAFLKAHNLKPFVSSTSVRVSTRHHPWQVVNRSLMDYVKNLNKNRV